TEQAEARVRELEVQVAALREALQDLLWHNCPVPDRNGEPVPHQANPEQAKQTLTDTAAAATRYTETVRAEALEEEARKWDNYRDGGLAVWRPSSIAMGLRLRAAAHRDKAKGGTR
ncbi:MAG: hypothetical protein ABH835_04525, partial [Patescibacteria group bacterium]